LPTLATVRGVIDRASAVASAGSWKCFGASRTNPNGSVTALNVPNRTNNVPSRSPSSKANSTSRLPTGVKSTSAVRSTTVITPAARNIRNERAIGPGIRCAW